MLKTYICKLKKHKKTSLYTFVKKHYKKHYKNIKLQMFPIATFYFVHF